MSVDKAIAKHKALQAAAKNISIEDVQNAWGSEWNVKRRYYDMLLTHETGDQYYVIDSSHIERGELSTKGSYPPVLYVVPFFHIDNINLTYDYLMQELNK